MKFPINLEKLSGELPKKNASLQEAKHHLKEEKEKYIPPEIALQEKFGKAKSYYHNKFHLGASIQPRSFWCLVPESEDLLGMNPQKPPLMSDSSLDAKPPWDKVKLSGVIESQFLFATTIGLDIIPFANTRTRILLLPALIKGKKLIMLNGHHEAFQLGFKGLSDYLASAEREWENRATQKSKKMTIYQRLDYQKGVTAQNPFAKFKVIYAASGTHLTCCVINQNEKFAINGIKLQGFIADKKTYYYDTDNEKEAYYISAILNSPVIDKLIKPLQTRGLFGERDIHKRPLLLPIPKFNESNETHKRLANHGKTDYEAVQKAMNKILELRTLTKQRAYVRELVKENLVEIDQLVIRVLGENTEKDLMDFMKQ